MCAIHRACRETPEEYSVPGNYVHGANIAGFMKVADACWSRDWSKNGR